MRTLLRELEFLRVLVARRLLGFEREAQPRTQATVDFPQHR